MNATLEKALSEARAVPVEEQGDLGTQILELLEERAIMRAFEESEAEGGEIPAEEVFAELRASLAN